MQKITFIFVFFFSWATIAAAQNKKAKTTPTLGVNTTKYVIAGPMLGFVEHRSATVWIEVASTADKVEIEYWHTENPKNRSRMAYKGELANLYNPLSFTLEALDMNTEYEYAIYVNNVLQTMPAPAPYRFHTKDLWEFRKPAPDFNFVFGSCLYINDSLYDRPGKPYGKSLAILKPMAEENAAFNLWLGDDLYLREADFSSKSGMGYRYSHDRATPELQPLLVARPNYASWDDHDFGPNDSDMSFRLKNESYNLFKKYWCNPTYGNGNEGVYTSFQWSDCEFFMLDDRTFRASDAMKDYNGDVPNADKTYWGKEQLTWLKNALLTSKATFKFVVNGNQMGNPMDKRESVINFPAEYQELTNFLNSNKINGIIYLSGDRHFSEVLRYDRPNDKKAYPIYEITNSPITSTPYSNMKEPELSNPIRVQGSLVNQENNYGVINVTGTKGNRQIVYQVKSSEGKKLYELSLNEKDLKWAKDKDKEEKE